MSVNLVVKNVSQVTDRIRQIEFADVMDLSLPSYSAGAHVDFDLGELGSRSYSLIDWAQPAEKPKTYTIAVQREESGLGGSMKMHELSVGLNITCSNPSNDFELADIDAPSLLLAGGIGITPIISMMAKLNSQGRSYKGIYTGRSQDFMAFLPQLQNSFGENLELFFDDQKPLDLQTLFKDIDPATQCYLCGPKGMIEVAKSAALTNGLADKNIHFELFAAPEAQSDDQPFEVELSSTGQVFTIPVGQTIIEVLEEAGVDVMFDCQRGDCGICQTEVISGTPDHRDVVLSKDEQAAGNVMQICVSRAKSARLVLDI
ncbi:MAG: oxidoreductase [Rhizobiaceae bacterium]|nr:oxidoreductase [Rhizobiaceae bacterium]